MSLRIGIFCASNTTLPRASVVSFRTTLHQFVVGRYKVNLTDQAILRMMNWTRIISAVSRSILPDQMGNMSQVIKSKGQFLGRNGLWTKLFFIFFQTCLLARFQQPLSI